MSEAHRRRFATAVHEAGHAIAAFAVGRHFKAVSIVPTDDTIGHVQSLRERPLDTQTLDELMDGAVISMSGYVAEREFGFRPRRSSWRLDRQHAADRLLQYSCGDQLEANLLIRVAEARSRRLARLWRPEIKAVAEGLVERGTLSFSDVSAAHESQALG